MTAGAELAHDTETPDVHTASDDYARRFEGGGRVALERQRDAVAHLLLQTIGHPLRILDLGGGHAQLAGQLRALGHRVVVHGSASGCFGRLSALPPSSEPLGRCVAGLLALPFPDASFDLVSGIRLLAHVRRWRALLDEMSRVSRRYVLVDYPVLAGAQRWSSALFFVKRRVEGNTRPFFLYRRTEIPAHLRTSGLQPVDAVGEVVLPLAMHRLAGMPRLSRAMEHGFAALGIARRVGSPVLLLAEKRDAAMMPAPGARVAGAPDHGRIS